MISRGAYLLVLQETKKEKNDTSKKRFTISQMPGLSIENPPRALGLPCKGCERDTEKKRERERERGREREKEREKERERERDL
jgi:hypothetical protein